MRDLPSTVPVFPSPDNLLAGFSSGRYAATVANAPLIGIDLVEPARLRDRLERTEGLDRTLFTDGELAYCGAQLVPSEHLAGRYSAKEAVVKALGIDGWDPLEIEIVGGGAEVGVLLHGEVAAVAADLGVSVSISMTHLGSVAAAVAMARPVAKDR